MTITSRGRGAPYGKNFIPNLLRRFGIFEEKIIAFVIQHRQFPAMYPPGVDWQMPALPPNIINASLLLKHFHLRGPPGEARIGAMFFIISSLLWTNNPFRRTRSSSNSSRIKRALYNPIAMSSFIRVRRRDCLSRFFRRARDFAPVMASWTTV
jgi:hypothetical protein